MNKTDFEEEMADMPLSAGSYTPKDVAAHMKKKKAAKKDPKKFVQGNGAFQEKGGEMVGGGGGAFVKNKGKGESY